LQELVMTSPQRNAVRNYRARLDAQGLARFEVLGRQSDRDLIRSIAKRLAEDTPEASHLRSELGRSFEGEPKRGGILEALRRSPLVGADLDAPRASETGRGIAL
jgi:hypothetical protein